MGHRNHNWRLQHYHVLPPPQLCRAHNVQCHVIRPVASSCNKNLMRISEKSYQIHWWYKVSRFYQISFMIVRTLRCLSYRFLHYNQNTVKDWSLMNFTHFWWIKSWWVSVAYLYKLKNVRNFVCIWKYLRKQICLASHIIDYHGELEKENLNINIWLMKVKMLDAKKWRI